MFENKINKNMLQKLTIMFLILSIITLAFSVLLQSKDGRRQILDKDGGGEEQLCNILSQIRGVGQVSVIMEYDNDEKVCGVIVTADGGSNPVIANDLTKGVATLYNIPVSNVIVFEKEQEE